MQTTPETDADIETAPALADALPYILSTWGRIVEARLEATPQQGFLHEFARIQAKIIKRSQVVVATSAALGGRIAGFVIYEPRGETTTGRLHFVAVREKQRRAGVGKRLMAASGLTRPEISFWTSDLRHLGLADAPYSPFWLRT